MAVRETTAVTTLDNALAVGLIGTPIKYILSASASLDFASAGTLTSPADLTITVTGANVGDTVHLGLPAAPTAGLVFLAFVSAANTVTVRAFNVSSGTIDAAAATYRVTVIGY